MSKFRIEVDRELCQGHSVCAAEARELFRVVATDSPYPQAEVLVAQPLDAQRALAERAARYCPNGAITIIEVND